jgi:hypothetical protein
MASSNNDGCAEVYFQQGSCNIILKQGDLLQENDVDVIVIPTPENGQNASHTYPLFEALCSKADQKLKDQIKKFSSKIKLHEKPQIILDSKPSIILTPIPYFGHEKKASEMLKTTYLACLSLAVKQNCQTIAFPTIGCGKSGFKSRDAADIVYYALAQFEQPRDKKMNEIRIIIYDKEIYNEFSDVFIDAGQKSNAKIKFIEMYELLYCKSYFAFDSCFFNPPHSRLLLIRFVDHGKNQTHLKCHRDGTTKEHRNDSHKKKQSNNN